MTQAYRRVQIAVDGGELTVGVWGELSPERPPVLAIHGITANHVSWTEVARHHDGAILAPDLRGRGGSRHLPGPTGMAVHAADALAVLDVFGVDQAIVVGHSMGAFVASVFAHRFPERVRRLVLVDGGVPFPPITGDVDEAMDTILGPALARLKLTWPDRTAVHDFWRAHPALADWNDVIEAYVDYDVGEDGTGLRSRIAEPIIREDGRDLHLGAAAKDAYASLPGAKFPEGAVFLHAERGLLDEPTPLYPDPEQLEDHIAVQRLPGSNHYTILFAPRFAAAVARAVENPISESEAS
ncbi:alpha/beta hydrolase [Cryptosporangium minutisporangium]|uniref:AB hydrolase-1 domain-containing protein n=1 Tax=Cryptosporangium minutisporangium TaxID=113569 RepID=A0ABP6T3L2_9ACTN